MKLTALQGCGWDEAEEQAAKDIAHAARIGYVSYGDAEDGRVYIMGTIRTILVSREYLDRIAGK